MVPAQGTRPTGVGVCTRADARVQLTVVVAMMRSRPSADRLKDVNLAGPGQERV